MWNRELGIYKQYVVYSRHDTPQYAIALLNTHRTHVRWFSLYSASGSYDTPIIEQADVLPGIFGISYNDKHNCIYRTSIRVRVYTR
jgi:hypothetical protein